MIGDRKSIEAQSAMRHLHRQGVTLMASLSSANVQGHWLKSLLRSSAGSRGLVACFLLGLVLSLPSGAWSQATSGSIEGVVTDESCAVIPDAEVTLRNLARGWTRTVRTEADGRY